MSTTPTGSYRLFQRLHPLSLLAQLTSRRATGCLRVFTGSGSWSIYLEDGKLVYASSSEKLFERLDQHLGHLSKQISSLSADSREQIRLMFDSNEGDKSILQPDYQAICWLVEREYISSSAAATLINELAKEIFESFLPLKEGSYEFNTVTLLDELPKFCRLDLRVLVEHCQKFLRSRQHIQPPKESAGVSQTLPVTNSTPIQPKSRTEQPVVEESGRQLDESLPRSNNFDNPDNSNQVIAPKPVGKSLYTVACIDDSPTVLNSIKHFLDDKTFAVVAINDPVKALMQILRSKPDLILLDVEMPNLDGYELCSLLRRHSAFKDIPIIMVTGRTGFIDRAKAKMVRSSGYLAKPFTQSDLLKIVFQHIT
jgi:two-component system, chemotaxis family, response regulator PixG